VARRSLRPADRPLELKRRFPGTSGADSASFVLHTATVFLTPRRGFWLKMNCPMDSRRLAIINTYLTIVLIALTIVLIVLTIVTARDARRLDALTHSLIGQPSTPPSEQSPTPTPTAEPVLKAIPITTPTPNLTPSPSPEPARMRHRHSRRHR